MSKCKSITKEEIENLPLKRYKGPIEIISSPNLVKPAFKEILKCKVTGFDTESKPTFRRGDRSPVALLQIATLETVFLFRLLETGVFPEINSYFEDPELTKIGIAPGKDFQELSQSKEINPKGVVDLNKYCRELGFKNVGAKNLSAMILGFRISKRQQTSNWENTELSKPQLHYAATDAWICREIYLKLQNGMNGFGLLNQTP